MCFPWEKGIRTLIIRYNTIRDHLFFLRKQTRNEWKGAGSKDFTEFLSDLSWWKQYFITGSFHLQYFFLLCKCMERGGKI